MEMASYKRMHVTELQQACEMQGLEHEGLNKKRLILALQRHAMHRGETEEEESDRPEIEPDGDGEVSFRRSVDRAVNGESINVHGAWGETRGRRGGRTTQPVTAKAGHSP